MNKNPYDLEQLNKELESALTNFSDYHKQMEDHLQFYQKSAFFANKAGEAKASADSSNNLLRVFADKNIHFTSAFPTIKVPTTGADPEKRQSASTREKIINGAWRKNNGALKQKKWSKDATLLSVAIAETGFDLRNRCAIVRRYDPRYCFWQLSNGNDGRLIAFWSVYPITKDECLAKYNVAPTGQPIPASTLQDVFLKSVDGKDWFLQVVRLDDRVRVAWVGDTIIEEPHEHMMGSIPIDMCMPFDDLDVKGRASFYLEPLVPLQAALNRTIQRRDRIVARYAHPVLWGRGIISKQVDDVKKGLKQGGFVGLKQGGELGLLQLNDLKVLSQHEEAIRADMLRVSGFSAAAMGELAGANTSGDALGMYFTPTQRHIEHQNIAWTAFYEGINAKILRAYEKFGKTGETFNLAGYSSNGTVLGMVDNSDRVQYQRGGYEIEFDKSVIDGNYNSIVVFNPVTPKNELEEKRLVVEAVTQKFLSRTTAYEMYGIESPEDELALLQQEQSEPALNPQGMQALVAAANAAQSDDQSTSNPPLPTSVAKDIKPNVQLQ